MKQTPMEANFIMCVTIVEFKICKIKFISQNKVLPHRKVISKSDSVGSGPLHLIWISSQIKNWAQKPRSGRSGWI